MSDFPEKYGKYFVTSYELFREAYGYKDLIDFYAACLYGNIYSLPICYKDTKHIAKFVAGNVYNYELYERLRNLTLTDVDELDQIIRGPIPRKGNELRLMVIGKAPGVDEETWGCNFIGPIGTDALTFIAEYNLWDIFDEIYLTNVVKWRSLIESEAYYRQFAKDCIPLLCNEIAIFEPDVIIYFGSKNVYQIMAEAINAGEFGNVSYFNLTCPKGEATGLVTGLSFRKTVDDRTALGKLAACLRGEAPVREIFTAGDNTAGFVVLDSVDSVQAVVDRWLQLGVKEVACDCEWYGRIGDTDAFLRTVQIAAKINDCIEVYVIAIADEKGCGAETAQAKIRELSRLLMNKNITIIGSFFYSDAIWLNRFGCDLTERYAQTVFTQGREGILDVAMAEAVIDEAARLNLCSLAARRIGSEAWDTALNEWAAAQGTEFFGHAPSSILYPYAAADVKVLILMAAEQRRLLAGDPLTGQPLFGPYASNMAMCCALVEMIGRGLFLDIEQLRQLKREFQTAYERLLGDVRAEVNWPEFDPNKTRHVIAVLFGNKYLDKPILPETAKCRNLCPVKSTNKKYTDWSAIPENIRSVLNVSVDAESLGILAQNDSFAGKLRDLSFVKQALKTVFGKTGLETYINDDGALHSFIAPTTETGRCRSSKPNIQNFSNRRNADYERICGVKIFPKDCLKPRDGYVLVEMDFTAAELYLLGVMSGSSLLMEHCLRSALPEDHPDYYDLHSQIAVHAFGLPCKPTKKALEAAGKKQFRVCAKSVVYGLNYGRGDVAIIRQVEAEAGIKVTPDDVKAIKDTFFTQYAEVPVLMEQLRAVVYNPGYQINYFGRTRRFKRINDEEFMAKQERESLNFAFQSMVAECLNHLAFYLKISDAKPILDYYILAPIHDALIFEVNKNTVDCFVNEYLPEVASLVKFGRWSPLGVRLTDPIYSLAFETKVKGEK